MKKALFLVVAAIVIASVATVAVEAQRRGPQPGQTGSGPTTGEEMIELFNPQYYLGEWEIEWTPPDTGLVPGGVYTGTETVTHINNRYLKIDI